VAFLRRLAGVPRVEPTATIAATLSPFLAYVEFVFSDFDPGAHRDRVESVQPLHFISSPWQCAASIENPKEVT